MNQENLERENIVWTQTMKKSLTKELERVLDKRGISSVKIDLKVMDNVVENYKEYGVTTDELYQAAYIGMWKACQGYKPEIKKDFNAFAYKCIEYAIIDAIAQCSKTIRLTRNYVTFLSNVSKVTEQFYKAGNLCPDDSDIAAKLNMDESTYRKKINYIKECNSWDEYNKDSQDWTSHQEDYDIYADSEYSQSKTDLTIVVKAMKKVLNSTDFEIMCELLGIEVDNGNITVVAEKTSDELGKKYGISGQAIREKHAKFIKKMRDYFGQEYKELLR